MCNADTIEQARYIATMAEKLANRVESRATVRREHPNTGLLYYGFDGIDETNNSTNIDRMITQLRVELLELRKMIDHA